MTQQEEQLIGGLIDRVSGTRLSEKDPDAERKLNEGLGRNPDALYILAQTVLVQQMALEQAQSQLADLRNQQTQQPKKATSFLGSIFGHDEPARPAPPPPPSPGYQPVPGAGQNPGYGAVPYGQGGFGSPQAAPGGFGAGASGGFLRGALQTATGVAAGALAFEGVESLLHGFGGGGSRGFGDVGGRPEEVVNNYYGDSGRDRNDDSSLSSDIEDRRGDSSFDSGDRLAATDDTGFGDADGTSDSGDDGDAFAGDDGDNGGFDSGDDSGDLGSGDDFGGDSDNFS